MNTEELLKIISESKSFKDLKEKLEIKPLEALTSKVFECGRDRYITSLLYKEIKYQVVFSKYYNTYMIDPNEPNRLIGLPADSALFEIRNFDKNNDIIVEILEDHLNNNIS